MVKKYKARSFWFHKSFRVHSTFSVTFCITQVILTYIILVYKSLWTIQSFKTSFRVHDEFVLQMKSLKEMPVIHTWFIVHDLFGAEYFYVIKFSVW